MKEPLERSRPFVGPEGILQRSIPSVRRSRGTFRAGRNQSERQGTIQPEAPSTKWRPLDLFGLASAWCAQASGVPT